MERGARRDLSSFLVHRSSSLSGAVATTLIVPVGAALAIGSLAASMIEPRWTAGGLPYATGYPKNVEITATLLGVAGGAATAGLARWPVAWMAALVLAAGGYMHVASLCGAPPVALWVPVLAAALVLAVALERMREPTTPAAPTRTAERFAAAAIVVALAASVFVLSIAPLTIDTFHHGEVLASAVDLLAGDRPFAWPHGLHDTGVAALWIVVSGKVGSSPIVLTYATAGALAVPTLYFLTRRGLGSPAAAATACWLPVVTLVLWRGEWAFAETILPMLGTLVWFAVALHLALGVSSAALAMAGALLIAGLAFRIDAAMFAAPAVVAALLYRRAIAPLGRTWRERVSDGLRAVALLACGAVSALAAAHLLFGWPDRFWLTTVFQRLPRYHSIANGMPFRWPCAQSAFAHIASRVPVASLVLATVLLAATTRRLTADRRAATPAPPPTAEQTALLVFLASFAFLSLRSALGRSDIGHFYWFYPVLFGSALLCLSPWLMRLRANPRGQAAVLAALVLAFAATVGPLASAHLSALAEHLRPNQPLGACADRTFTRSEAAYPLNAGFVDDTCRFEHLLREHGIQHLIFDHAAPWYAIRFGARQPPWMYRAYAPADQRQFIDALRGARTQALLKVRGYGAMPAYDVPNFYRIPILEAYLRARRAGAPTIETPLGTLYLWDQAGVRAPPSRGPNSDAPDVTARIDAVVAVPSSGFLEVRGVTVYRLGRTLSRLTVDDPPDAELMRADKHVRPGQTAWSVTVRAAPADVSSIRLTIETDDGRKATVTLDLPPARLLPALSGDEWRDLHLDVEAAAALGRADRAAAQHRPH